MKSSAASGALLMLIVTLILAYGAYILSYIVPAGRDMWEPLKYAGIMAGSAWTAWGILALAYKRGDHHMLPLALFIVSMSWLEIYRLGIFTEDFAQGPRQAVFTAVSMAVFLLIVLLLRDYRVLEDYKYLFLISSLCIQIAVMIFGSNINGATLWIEIKGYSFQPFEFVRIALVFFLASYLKQFRDWFSVDLISKNWRIPHKAFAMLGVGMAAAEIVLVIQRDLGMALLLFGLFISLFYAVINRRDILTLAFVLSGIGAYCCWKYFTHVQERVSNWMDPFASFEDKGYQMCQSIFSLANAGFDGTGLGLGTAGHIPAAVNDFTFIAFTEEFGMLGAAALLIGLMMLFADCFSVSLRVKDDFGAILSSGLVFMLSWQSLINLLGVTKVLPMTGVTLPFVSAGGTSTLSCFVVLALIWRIDVSDGRRIMKKKKKADGSDGN